MGRVALEHAPAQRVALDGRWARRRIARGGQIIDASIVSAPIQRKHARGKTRASNKMRFRTSGAMPSARRKTWMRAGRASTAAPNYGDKLHANVDRSWGFIRVHDVSSANVHDSRHFERLLDAGNTARTIRVDGACTDRDREARLKEEGYRVDIKHNGTRAATH
ncbi:hypothetical protein EYR01_23450 [Xanthomonas oryzae pv. oryzae]|nr:hypothetical protein EYR01_23450 [Xanthomonas oryzae pv. oryzae]